jgi:hypothetical protein
MEEKLSGRSALVNLFDNVVDTGAPIFVWRLVKDGGDDSE